MLVVLINCPLKERSQNWRLPGIETNDSGADRGAIVREEIKESRVGVGAGLVLFFKISEIIWAVIALNGVIHAIGITKLAHTAEGPVEENIG